MNNYFPRLTATEKELEQYKKSNLKLHHSFRIISKRNKHGNEVLRLNYFGKYLRSDYDNNKDFDIKKLEILARLNIILNAVELSNLSFEDVVSWDGENVDVAITRLGNDAILVVIELNEINILISENNYQNMEEMLKKFKDGFYNAKLHRISKQNKDLGHCPIYEV